MTDRAHIPSSPACGHWETLLADALDGLLKPEDEATFAAHMSGCEACTALFDQARKGREWLEFLSPEPEVPAGLLSKILAQTGPGQKTGLIPVTGVLAAVDEHTVPAWQRGGFMAQVSRFAEPRLMMTAAMAFFSLALTLNLTGVRIADLHLADVRMANFRPAALRSFMERRLTAASVPVIRYYDNLRFVYEVESRMQEMRHSDDDNQDNSGSPRNNAAPKGAGQSQRTPGLHDGGSFLRPQPQQSGQLPATPAPPAHNRFVEASLTNHQSSFWSTIGSNFGLATPARAFRRLQIGSSQVGTRERSTGWIA
jgi:hypothetical protein